MAEALAAIGLVGSIVQFISLGSKVAARLNEFQKSINDVPKVFGDIKIELPLLLDTLRKTKEQAESGSITLATQKAVLPVVGGCIRQVELLDEVLNKVLVRTEDSSWQRSRKALSRYATCQFSSSNFRGDASLRGMPLRPYSLLPLQDPARVSMDLLTPNDK